MKIWQADFYKFSLNQNNSWLWKLLICDLEQNTVFEQNCQQEDASANWLIHQINQAAGDKLPDVIQIFRPQALGLFTVAAQQLGIKVEATRRTKILKQQLNKYITDANYPLAIDRPPPQPLPESLWGEQWNFATITADSLSNLISDRPIPILDTPTFLLPINLGIASTINLPGVVIYAGKQSLKLARWLAAEKPFSLNYIDTEAGKSGGLILESGLVDRWIMTTFEDEKVAQAGKIYEQRKQLSKGLHFLLIQPDDSGMTYTGLWLLKEE
ncbi:protein of unknown function DUF1092 [Stanieria cyanosphaera PCC 7437]|uniref:DUF1092 family protein n=1 Tax=Stanieria cyanosphaera (strain ATCC 29371 / PCC 7437) TaxID=111780 RepID=K9XW05_STAC7|nr:Tab2/Atab2 family RNA-binding protein [Stanieria cyanosphaera]AFZ36770.1 protein of unknown function DUF1092 [Stanieria cyanosphaera PCC 7437]